MFYKLRKRLRQERFNLQIRDVLRTPPMPVVDAPWTVVSMVGNAEVAMYVLAIKSLYPKLGGGKLLAIVDRDMPRASRDTLAAHLPGIALTDLEDIDPSPCQRGGTWERLVHLVRLSEAEYVVQVDADTLALDRDLDEVVECIRTNTSFAYADNHWSVKSLREAAADAEAFPSDYVGIALERSFAGWPDADRLQYVRASSGFAGYARGGASMALLEEFHAQMKRALGPRWREWGTEQSGSNFVVANAQRRLILPFPAYATFTQPEHAGPAKFRHYIGTHRYAGSHYPANAKRIIGELMAA